MGCALVSLQTEGFIPPASGSAVGRWSPAVGSLRNYSEGISTRGPNPDLLHYRQILYVRATREALQNDIVPLFLLMLMNFHDILNDTKIFKKERSLQQTGGLRPEGEFSLRFQGSAFSSLLPGIFLLPQQSPERDE